jgi:hypothetical protein
LKSLDSRCSLPLGVVIEGGNDGRVATAEKKYEATIWTQDSDFKHLNKVKYFPKND